MDTAFLNRTGVTGGWIYVDYNFYPDKDKHPWIRRIVPFTFLQGGRDRDPRRRRVHQRHRRAIELHPPGFLPRRRAVLAGTLAGPRVRGRTRPHVRQRPAVPLAAALRQLQLRGSPLVLRRGRSVPGQVRERQALARSSSPTAGSREDVEYTHIAFDRPSTGERVYTVNIVNTRTTYQFSKEFAIRAIVQYDSQQRRVLTDFLGSYELRPGTVVYAGYGSLYEKRAYQDDDWVDGQGTT